MPGTPTSDVTDGSLVMHVDFENLYWSGHPGESMNENPGGISGGPVYRVIEGAPIDRLEIVGFVYEYFEPWETMRARHVDRVMADGRIQI